MEHREHVPERVLPVCTATPKDIQSLVKAEFDDIKALVGPKSRKMLQARSRVRALAVIESVGSTASEPNQESEQALEEGESGQVWWDLFPGIASLELSANTEEGIPVAIRITKKEGEAVHLVPEGSVQGQ